MTDKVDSVKRNEFLSEKEMAYAIKIQLEKLGYIATAELVLTNKHFNLNEKTKENVSKIRIDVAAYKNNKVTFIEVENGLWTTHPLIYREFAHFLLLAYPTEYTSPTDSEQINLAKAYGIGIISVSRNGSIKSILRPEEYTIPKDTTKAIISLIHKRKAK